MQARPHSQSYFIVPHFSWRTGCDTICLKYFRNGISSLSFLCDFLPWVFDYIPSLFPPLIPGEKASIPSHSPMVSRCMTFHFSFTSCLCCQYIALIQFTCTWISDDLWFLAGSMFNSRSSQKIMPPEAIWLQQSLLPRGPGAGAATPARPTGANCVRRYWGQRWCKFSGACTQSKDTWVQETLNSLKICSALSASVLS